MINIVLHTMKCNVCTHTHTVNIMYVNIHSKLPGMHVRLYIYVAYTNVLQWVCIYGDPLPNLIYCVAYDTTHAERGYTG